MNLMNSLNLVLYHFVYLATSESLSIFRSIHSCLCMLNCLVLYILIPVRAFTVYHFVLRTNITIILFYLTLTYIYFILADLHCIFSVYSTLLSRTFHVLTFRLNSFSHSTGVHLLSSSVMTSYYFPHIFL